MNFDYLAIRKLSKKKNNLIRADTLLKSKIKEIQRAKSIEKDP
jgi:hypothetical protein